MSGRAERADVDAVVVGAGFGGLYMVYKLRELGFSVKGFERAEDVGGVWCWNNYPGARCDGESLAYSYSFSDELQQEWHWPERYAAQPDIVRYVRSVADRFGIRQLFAFRTSVTSATWDDDRALWTIETDRGERVTARFFISAVGCLSAARLPDIPGIEDFAGAHFHTGLWPKDREVELAGKRVAVIGTGSSGIQIITKIAPEVERLTVFQRTAPYSVPARNRPMDPEHESHVKANYPYFRTLTRGAVGQGFGMPIEGDGHDFTHDQREAAFAKRWAYGGAPFLFSFSNIMTDREINEHACEFVRDRIREIVNDPETAEMLCPKGYPIGAKRLCVDTGYYETYNRDNVSLIDVKADPIKRITHDGLELASGRGFTFDTIIFATGYDAMTGALLNMDIRGRDGISLREKWSEGPRAYLGLCAEGFPNMFMMTGPGSPSVLSNVVVSLEQHADLIGDALTMMRDEGLATIEADKDAEDCWVDHVRAVADATLWPLADSWYRGKNIPGKPDVFMVYVAGPGRYREECEEMKAKGWEGFAFRANDAPRIAEAASA